MALPIARMDGPHAKDVEYPDADDDKRGQQMLESSNQDQQSLDLDIESFLNSKEEARLRLKIDWYICPTVMILYLWCFIDRANIGNARIAGLEKTLGMSGFDYNILNTCFYIAYIVFELPAMWCCKKYGPGRWLPGLSVGFGLLSLVTAFCHNFGSACAVRFILGAFEAGMLPGISYYLSRWYRKSELVFRLSLYFVSSSLAGAFGGLLASAILKIPHIGSVKEWQMIFLIEGLITIVVAVAAFWTLTDRPATARWLTEREKRLAIARIESEQVGTVQALDKLTGKRFLRGIRNPHTMTIAIIFLFVNITVQGVAFFLPTIVRTIYPGRSVVQQQLRTVPPYLVGAFISTLLPYISYKVGKRLWVFLLSAPLVMAGYIMFLSSTKPQVRYAATFIIVPFSFVFGALTNAQVAANCGSDSARASGIGFNVMVGNLGGLISTWSFLPGDAPYYKDGAALNLSCATAILALSIGLYVWVVFDNKRRDKVDAPAVLSKLSDQEIADLDYKHPNFRWTT